MVSKSPRTRSESPQNRRITFKLEAPEAQEVRVTGNFCDWQLDQHPLKQKTAGVWQKTLTLPPGRYEYRFLVDGVWQDDPGSAERAPTPFNSENSVLHVR